MVVHLHTVSHNESRMLDFFFRHYEPWVDHFFICDDGSTDGTRERLEMHGKVTVTNLHRTNPESWVLSAKQVYNSSWKQSRSVADWVVVTNIDEHLYHPRMLSYLAACAADSITAIPALGYQMVSAQFPASDCVLTRDCRTGAPWANMSKLEIFNPRLIEEINFMEGRHKAAPTGAIVLPRADEVLNLHYKYLGLAFNFERHHELSPRFGSIDVAHGWGHKYLWRQEQLRDDMEEALRASIDVMEPGRNHHLQHTAPRWWKHLPTAGLRRGPSLD